MYEGGGAGGATVNTPAGGQISQGNSSAPTGGASAGIGAMAQLGLMKAQEENIRANTEKTKTEQAKLAGTDTEESQARIAGYKTQNEINAMSKDDQILYYKEQAQEKIAQREQAGSNATVAINTTNNRIKQTKAEAIGAQLNNALTQAKTTNTNTNTKYTETQTKAIADQISTQYINAYANQKNAGANEKNAETNLYNQIKNELYQKGILEQKNEQMNRETIMNIVRIIMGAAPTTTTTQGDDGYKETTTQKGW